MQIKLSNDELRRLRKSVDEGLGTDYVTVEMLEIDETLSDINIDLLAYYEFSHQDVAHIADKLRSLNMTGSDADDILMYLTEQNVDTIDSLSDELGIYVSDVKSMVSDVVTDDELADVIARRLYSGIHALYDLSAFTQALASELAKYE